MSAGTITLTNGSAAVDGVSTTFTSDLKSGDVISTTIGGVAYTLFVDAVTSNTSLKLSDVFTGPTTADAAYVAVPAKTLSQLPAQLVTQTAEAVRRVLQQNANFQAFYNDTGDITMILPDGTPYGKQVTGPSWEKLSDIVKSTWADRGQLAIDANLNTMNPATTEGEWSKSSSTGLTVSNGFPAGAGQGVLRVHNGGSFSGTQVYTDRSANIWVRTLTAAWNGTDGPWSVWINVSTKSLRSTDAVTGFNLNKLYGPENYGSLRIAGTVAAACTVAANGVPYDGFSGVVTMSQGFAVAGGTQQVALSSNGLQFSRYMDSVDGQPSAWVEVGRQTRPTAFTGNANALFDAGEYATTAATTGLIMPGGLSKMPDGVLRVSTRVPGEYVQEWIVIGTSATQNNRRFSRTYYSGTWQPWREVYDENSLMLRLGLGGTTGGVALTAFDFQNAVVEAGAIYRVPVDNVTNMPAGITFTTGTDLFIQVDGVSSNGSRISLEVIPDTAANANYKVYKILGVGNAGSRVFSVRQQLTSADVVPIGNGGTGATTKEDARNALELKGASLLDVGTAKGTVAAGDDSRLSTVHGKTGGTISTGVAITSGDLYLNSGNLVSIFPVPVAPQTGQYANGGIIRTGYSGVYAPYYTDFYTQTVQGAFTQSVITLHASNIQSWVFNQSGNATAPGSWVSGSDERHKSNIVLVPNPLEAVLSWRGCTYDKKDGVSEVGLIAQDVEKNCPVAVFNTGRRTFSDKTVIEDFKSLNVAGASAAYHTEAIKELFNLVKLALNDPAAARTQIEAIEVALNAGKNQADTQP